ncbi:uncharacterized protein F5147DRAFT_657754 [Suillus discolor]|uniref:Uncharacterized protein n=1 Tax=Suillus discolor TaxID=1912936 RepID=A0A9P7JNL0_9AGAM|nr:uncharacterized protein F5147DRAFT_657754 [Suillus discolor]KAG2092135.1 hypothetical protein F5147DRAFT_657754 [Suillus discolor]
MTYIYNHIPGIITGFEHTGSFSDLRLDLDFACYILSQRNIGPCYWPTKVSMEHFWPLQKEPPGYIAMNGHRGPLVKASGRAEYEVLVPIFGLMPQDKDVLNQNVEVVSRVYNYNLIAVWMWPEFTEDFEDGSFSQIYTDDHTTASFQQHCQHNVYGFVPSSSNLGSALVPAVLPISPLALVPSQAPTSDDFVAVDELMLPQIIKLSEDLRWTTRSAPDGNSHCQSILAELSVDYPWSLIVRSLKTTLFGSLITGRYGNTMRVVKLWPFRHQFITQCFLEGLSRVGWSYQDLDLTNGVKFHWHHLRATFDHRPNSSLSDLQKVIGHCLQPCRDLGFCLDATEWRARITRMTAVLDEAAVQLDQG